MGDSWNVFIDVFVVTSCLFQCYMLQKPSPTAGGNEEEVHLKLYLDHSEHYPALVKPLPGNVPDLQLGVPKKKRFGGRGKVLRFNRAQVGGGL